MTFEATPVINTVDESKRYRDPITRFKYSLPGDAMLFLIFRTKGATAALAPLKITTRKLVQDQNIALFGYPSKKCLYRLDTICPISTVNPNIKELSL